MEDTSYHLPVNEPNRRFDVMHTMGSVGRTIARHITVKRILLIGMGSLVIGGIGLIASFYWPQTLQFSYAAAQHCVVNPTLFPRAVSGRGNRAYDVRLRTSLAIAGYPLYAHTTCVTPLAAPREHQTATIRLTHGMLPFLHKTMTVKADSFPVLADTQSWTKPISTKAPLILTLNSTDRVFTYWLAVDGKVAACTTTNNKLSCDLPKLNLAQSAAYTATVERQFHGKPAGIILKQAFTTVEAVTVVSSTIGLGQVVYDAPAEVVLTLNRPAVSAGGVRLAQKLGGTEAEIPTTTVLSLTDKTITVRFSSPLPRSASLALALQTVTASDGGYLAQPYELAFTTSGGPKVQGVNIGTYKVSPSATIALTFDTDVSTTQNIAEFVRLESGNSTVPATVTLRGKTVAIAPHTALGGCTAFKVRVLDGLQNTHGISGGSAWQLNSRTICQTVFSIGTSVQGRAITAYRFGNGASKIVYVGTTHGDEQSTTATLYRWIDAIEANPSGVPAHRTIIIIPNLNPDGYAANRRTNAHTVDLNRNFPANNWKSGVTMPDKSYLEYGGGTAPLSEPESKALADYIVGLNPRLVLTYHATGGVVVPNDSGDSQALAGIYDQKSNVYFMSNSLTGVFFEYDTTGAFEDWLHDKYNVPALLIELWTSSGNEFGSHSNAMWHMAQLP